MWNKALKTASLESSLGYFPCREGRLSPHLIHLTSSSFNSSLPSSSSLRHSQKQLGGRGMEQHYACCW